jgi:hypothetical protein
MTRPDPINHRHTCTVCAAWITTRPGSATTADDLRLFTARHTPCRRPPDSASLDPDQLPAECRPKEHR